MMLKPGLDLTAFYNFYPQLDRPLLPSEIDIERARALTNNVGLASPTSIPHIQKGIGFDRDYINLCVEDDIFSPETKKAMASIHRSLVSISLRSVLGTSICYDIEGIHGDSTAMSIIDRSVALIDAKTGLDLYYDVTLSHLDSCDGSDVDVELAEFAFSTVVNWQIENDLKALRLSLAAEKLKANLFLSVSCGPEGIPIAISDDIECSSWKLLRDWKDGAESTRSLYPVALRCFGEDVQISA